VACPPPFWASALEGAWGGVSQDEPLGRRTSSELESSAMSARPHMVPPDDWRRSGQEEFPKGITLRLEAYRPPRPSWDHDHCEFCSAKISQFPADLAEGWTTQDHYRWICATCFDDFRDEIGWTVVGRDG
jgi:hypothetical protein